MPTFKNITDNDLNLIGYGIVKAGATFESDIEIESQNVVLVEESKPKEKVKADGGTS